MIFGLLIIAFLIAFRFYRKTVPPLSGWRRWLLLILRTLCLFLVFVLLFNPILKFSRNKVVHPLVVLLSDTSASMQQDDGAKKEIFGNIRNELANKYKKTNCEIVDADFANGLNGTDNNTLLGKTFSDFSRENGWQNVEEIYLFSDGWFKDEDLDFLDKLNLPVNCFAPDLASDDYDLEIKSVQFNSTAYRDEDIPFYAQISSQNFAGAAKVIFTVNGKVVQENPIQIKSNDQVEIRFDQAFGETGLQELQFAVQSDSLAEKNKDNNVFPASIRIMDNKLKCLICSDGLGWDESFITKSLQPDEHWQSQYLLKTDDFYFRKMRVNLDKELSSANTLILINHGNLNISRNEAGLISNFVAKGGGLIYFGKIIPNLESLLPARKSTLYSSFAGTIRFTEESSKYQTFRWEDNSVIPNLPPIDYYYVSPKIQAQILATVENDQQSPAILFQPLEAGKVMYFAFLNSWKWQMWLKGDYYNTFMHNLISWFGQQDADRIVVKPDKASYFAGEDVTLSLQVFTEQFNLSQNVNALMKLYDENDKLVKEDYFTRLSDTYKLQISDLPAGKYHFTVDDQVSRLTGKGEFAVLDFNPEWRDKGINKALLAYICRITNGQLLKSADDVNMPDKQLQYQKIVREIPLYTKWYLIAIFLLAFCLELYLRKRWGLL